MEISYDPAKREKALDGRGLDFEDAPNVFSGITFEVQDCRKDYGETRMICFGHLAGRMVVIGYTTRGAVRHIFSMRKANEREQVRIGPHLEI
ncbi:MAG: BrnT family toxin [Dokdonella sp.]